MIEGSNRGGNELPTFRECADTALFARINEIVDDLGSTKAAAEAIGVSVDTVARWRKGPTMPPFDKLAALCRASGFRVEWLATGEGPRGAQLQGALTSDRTDQEHGASNAMQRVEETSDASRVRFLPQLAVEASAGTGLISLSEEVEGFVALNESYLREMGVDPRHAHVLRVSGRSMAPTINDKDIVVVDTSVRTPTSEGVFTLVYGETVLIKRIRLQRDGGVILVSDNKSEGYTDETVPRSELASLHIVGRVKGHIRSL